MKKTLTLLALFLTALLSAQPRQTTYSTVRDISYTDSDDAYAREYCKLDVYYPAFHILHTHIRKILSEN